MLLQRLNSVVRALRSFASISGESAKSDEKKLNKTLTNWGLEDTCLLAGWTIAARWVVCIELFYSSSYGVVHHFGSASVAQRSGLDQLVDFVCQRLRNLDGYWFRRVLSFIFSL
jgi:hypothetical protein